MAKHRRRLSRRSPSVDLPSPSLPLSLRDVYLLTAESAGQVAIGQLTLVIDDHGLRVIAPEGEIAAKLAWSELTVLQTAGRLTAPGGEDAVLLEASSAVRTHRFAVPTGDPRTLESTIAAITGVAATTSSRRIRRGR
ncbi:MAG TPA: hypothetical protein VIJ09_02610 [Acidimicrobiales bacterium]